MQIVLARPTRPDTGALDIQAHGGFGRADTARASKPLFPANFSAESSVMPSFPGAVGNSPELQSALEKAARLARSRVSILLQGETGVGKEVMAQGIHSLSPLSDGPLVALNCGGLTRDLLASELFGHIDGAFTGARRGGMAGKIEGADGGTLFLDELGEMPLDLQPHFLRVLEDGQFYRVGDNKPRKSRFRLIAATNRDLREEVLAGRFRSDLFYRISVTSVQIPPLRERSGDVRVLARLFLRRFCQFHEVPEKAFSPEALERMELYPWPGNVRELRNLVESLVLTVSGTVIGQADLPLEVVASIGMSNSEKHQIAPPNSFNVTGLARAEFDMICEVLRVVSGNATLAAKQLGMAKSTLLFPPTEN